MLSIDADDDSVFGDLAGNRVDVDILLTSKGVAEDIDVIGTIERCALWKGGAGRVSGGWP